MPPPTYPTLSILAIGDELTCGERVDTNSAWIAARAGSVGVRVIEHRTASDDLAQITGAIRDLSDLSTVLVMTGGLGPTLDDLTRHALAEVLGEPLVEDAAALKDLLAWYEGRGRSMPQTNRVQALRPASARCLANPNGTAPGLVATVNNTKVFCLPGPPREMEPMFTAEVLPAFVPDPAHTTRVRAVPTFGLGESAVAERLGDLMDRRRNPQIGTTASGGIVTCRVRASGTAAELDAMLDETVRLIRERLDPAVLTGHDAEDDGLVLVRVVSGLLRSRGETVATVESCTGGLLGEMITRLPGSSGVFAGGLLTYSNALKAGLAGVSPGVIERHGAVSEEVATAMALGGLRVTGAAHTLAITGVAGPEGGSDAKPVGTVWIARATNGGGVDARRFQFRGGRDWIRQWSAVTALGMLRLSLLGAEQSLLGQAPSGA